VLAVAWLALLLSAPLLPAPIAAVAYAIGSLICHQRPERSFHIDAFQLPVCARCIGIYAGVAAGALVGALLRLETLDTVTQRLESRRFWGLTRGVTLAACVPTAATVGLEWLGVWQTSNLTRALAGAPLGFAVAVVVTGALATLQFGECAPRRPTASHPPRPPI
jgi:uncharacterized membrane protein